MEKKKSIFKGIPYFSKRDLITLGILAGAYILYYVLSLSGLVSNQIRAMIVPISYYIILAVSLNLMVGYLGELSLGHAGFMAVGAYSGCLVSLSLQSVLPMAIRLPLAMLAGGIVAALFGIVIGIPALRLRGDYLAIVTLAFGEIIKNLFENLEITGGALGLDTHAIYSSKAEKLLPYAIVAVFLTVILVMNLVRSKHGRAITAIRDNRIAAEATGLNVTYYKLLIFAIAAFFAGVAGVLYGHNFPNIRAAKFDYNLSIEILVMVVLGGMSSIRGSVIAAVLLYALPEMLRQLDDYRMLIYAILLIAVMILNASPKFVSIRNKLNFGYLIELIKKKMKKNKAGNTEEEKV